ncbi:MAG: penicillin-binding protein activator LpoB [Spirochaetaceae bacterium]|nr:penicillin-binding protein activator LpoB [Spirochaetaceae bacterium]
MAKNKILQGIGFIAVMLGACSTTVPIKSVRMPTIDTTGIQRLAIKPFENVSGVGGPLGAQITQYLTDKSTQMITATGKFTIVAQSDPNADGVFSGIIKRIEVKDSQEHSEWKDKDGKTHTSVTYKREVSLEFSYSILSSRTDMPVGTVLKQGSSSASSSESSDQVTDPLILAKNIADAQMSKLTQDIVPYIVSENRKLMNETSKDKTLKEKMKTAQTLVKNGNYEEALQHYDAINREYDSPAARTNAAILQEAIASDAAARTRLTQLFEDKDGLPEKAVKNAIAEINAKLPAGTNITILKLQSPERTLLDYAVDEMTKRIIQEGRFRIIDRSNQALIDAEQQFQASGAVGDDSAVSIGNQLGVQYITLCWISGEKSLRRLNLKGLDVETGQVVYQTDFEI